MAWFKRESGELDTSGEKKVRTEGLWVKCENCRQVIWKKDLEENMNVCPKCDKHFRIDARTRLAQLLDDNQYAVFDDDIASTDPLKFVDLKPYSSRLKQAQHDTGLNDAVINAQGKQRVRARIDIMGNAPLFALNTAGSGLDMPNYNAYIAHCMTRQWVW